jgi:hypothetical protein
MRENRTYGSEGGEGPHPFPTPIEYHFSDAMDAYPTAFARGRR